MGRWTQSHLIVVSIEPGFLKKNNMNIFREVFDKIKGPVNIYQMGAGGGESGWAMFGKTPQLQTVCNADPPPHQSRPMAPHIAQPTNHYTRNFKWLSKLLCY